MRLKYLLAIISFVAPAMLVAQQINDSSHIRVASRVDGDRFLQYYVTKHGRIVGRDSVFIFDNAPDVQSEGFIRFRDPVTGKVGMFNNNGDVAIPAKYDVLGEVSNGMVIAIQGAQKKYWNGDAESSDGHYSWDGGRRYLIDTTNRVLIEGFTYKEALDIFSLTIGERPHPDKTRESFRSVDGRFYAFINVEKKFSAWLSAFLRTSLTKEKLLAATHPEVTYWKEDEGWVSETKSSFMERNYELLATKLLSLTRPNCKYSIGQDWGSVTHMRLIITYDDRKVVIQDHLCFRLANDGYKFWGVTIRNGRLK